MARLERAVLLLLCIFAVKFVFSTAARQNAQKRMPSF